ncbi:hypothetical protein CC85DRAFT_286361 [Cutaneotrichosporon oleaginosum]|uniref:Uncharacterized protein n=1 Tax=Cutaneotrichosporon oleaginosum TaxID=879819 RepID=A0A0J0XKH5_9TREE|nr:uncharacterized protein CC85DRAFT_286361 [Cutaneotrichosporon oleaginosum]KLT41585.1 hypothetical protein CC85DRAFT_286361 [Cutaneotrichosporon oleaginosum]TXT09351.1 hypothetical protein COLE_03285 [Cutaneotrichosporon oleaginosum]
MLTALRAARAPRALVSLNACHSIAPHPLAAIAAGSCPRDCVGLAMNSKPCPVTTNTPLTSAPRRNARPLRTDGSGQVGAAR